MGPTLLSHHQGPAPGRVKTRPDATLHPQQAAKLAGAALDDTLAAALTRRGACWSWTERRELGAARAARRGRAARRRAGGAAGRGVRGCGRSGDFCVGMDTPQVTPELLDAAWRRSTAPTRSSAPGPLDRRLGAVGVRRPAREAFRDVPMSEAGTALAQRTRLRGARRRRAARSATSTRSPTPAPSRRGAPDGRFAAAAGDRLDGPRDRGSETRLPADLGRLLATAAGHTLGGGPPAVARVRVTRGAPARALARRARRRRRRRSRGGRALGARPRVPPAATSRRSGRPAGRAPLPRGRVRLARRRGGGAVVCSAPCRTPGAGGRRCCSTATSGSAARRRCCLRRSADADGRRDRAGRGGPPGRCPRGGTVEAAGSPSEWLTWARVGLDGIGPLTARRAWRTRTRSPPAGADRVRRP